MNSFRFDHPEYLWLLLLALPIVWLGMRSLATLEAYRRWTAIAVRVAVLLVLVLMIAGLQTVQRHSDLTVIAVIDQSESVRKFARPPADSTQADNQRPASIDQWVRQYLREASKGNKRQDDRYGEVRFDGRATVSSLPRNVMDLDAAAIEQPMEGTRGADAIRSALALYPADSGARLVFFSDGNETGNAQGLIDAAREAAAANIPIDVVPIAYRVDEEVMVEGVYTPAEAREGQTVAVRVVLRGTNKATGVLQLLQDEQVVDLNGPAEGTGMDIAESDWSLASDDAPGSHADGEGNSNDSSGGESGGDSGGEGAASGRFILAKQIDLPLGYTGVNKFRAVFEPDGGDTMAVNNRAESFTLVNGKGRILFVDNIGGDSGAILPNALLSHGIELEVVSPRGLPTSITRLSKYDAVVFQNVPRDEVTGPQQKALAKYIHDMGGGFVMLGGPDSFGAGAWTNTDIDKFILPVSCEIPSQTILPSGALVIVLDRSGSMSSPVAGTNKSQQELANEAAVLALSTLYPQDMVGVVVFDHSAQWASKLDYNNNPNALANKVRSIHPEGGTNIYSGLDEAYRALAPVTMQDAAVKHVILLTDGQSTPPPGSGGYVKLVGMMAAHDITLSTIGVGDGHDAMLLNQLATMGGGQYHAIVNPQQLPQVFIKEAKQVRKNLIKEEPFNPVLVNSGSPVMQGIDALPPLKGLVLTGPKHDPRVFQPIEGPNGEPVFAHWQVGLGRSAAFTSDATNKWAADWLRWGGYADFWARTMRQIARPSQSREADLLTSITDGRLKVRLDAAGFEDGKSPDASFRNFMSVQGAVLRPDGTTEPITLEQTGPGVYEADTSAIESGNYIVSLFVTDGAGERRAVFGGVSRPPGDELRRFESNLAVLQQVAAETGGRVLDPRDPAQAGLFSRENYTFESKSVRPLWRTLLVWLLAMVLLDVANRRIAWDPVAVVAAVKKFGSSMVLKSRHEESAQTLGQLKKKRADVQATRTGAEARPGVPPPMPVAPAPDRARKFDAPEGAVARESFAEAVGAAREDGTSKTLVTAAMRKSKAGDTAEPATTSRLLAAKQRARERLADEKDK